MGPSAVTDLGHPKHQHPKHQRLEHQRLEREELGSNRAADRSRSFSDERRDVLRPSDSVMFWHQAFSWMWRTVLGIALAKVGIVLLWAALTGRGIELKFWWGVIPYFQFDLDRANFVKLVTISTWLGLAAMFVAIIFAWSSASRLRHVKTHNPFDAWILDNAARGTWLGALTGSLVVLATIVLELLRDRFFGEYVWSEPHVSAIALAGIPLAALSALALTGWFLHSTSFAALGFEVSTVASAASATSEEAVS